MVQTPYNYYGKSKGGYQTQSREIQTGGYSMPDKKVPLAEKTPISNSEYTPKKEITNPPIEVKKETEQYPIKQDPLSQAIEDKQKQPTDFSQAQSKYATNRVPYAQQQVTAKYADGTITFAQKQNQLRQQDVNQFNKAVEERNKVIEKQNQTYYDELAKEPKKMSPYTPKEVKSETEYKEITGKYRVMPNPNPTPDKSHYYLVPEEQFRTDEWLGKPETTQGTELFGSLFGAVGLSAFGKSIGGLVDVAGTSGKTFSEGEGKVGFQPKYIFKAGGQMLTGGLSFAEKGIKVITADTPGAKSYKETGNIFAYGSEVSEFAQEYAGAYLGAKLITKGAKAGKPIIEKGYTDITNKIDRKLNPEYYSKTSEMLEHGEFAINENPSSKGLYPDYKYIPKSERKQPAFSFKGFSDISVQKGLAEGAKNLGKDFDPSKKIRETYVSKVVDITSKTNIGESFASDFQGKGKTLKLPYSQTKEVPLEQIPGKKELIEQTSKSRSITKVTNVGSSFEGRIGDVLTDKKPVELFSENNPNRGNINIGSSRTFAGKNYLNHPMQLDSSFTGTTYFYDYAKTTRMQGYKYSGIKGNVKVTKLEVSPSGFLERYKASRTPRQKVGKLDFNPSNIQSITKASKPSNIYSSKPYLIAQEATISIPKQNLSQSSRQIGQSSLRTSMNMVEATKSKANGLRSQYPSLGYSFAMGNTAQQTMQVQYPITKESKNVVMEIGAVGFMQKLFSGYSPMQKTQMKLEQRQRQTQGLLQFTKAKTMDLTKQETVQKTSQIKDTSLKHKQTLNYSFDTMQDKKQIQMQRQDQKQIQMQRKDQKQIKMQRQDQKTSLKQKQRQIFDSNTSSPRQPTRTRFGNEEPKPKPLTFPIDEDFKKSQAKEKQGQAYNAYAKQGGKYIKVNQEPLTRNGALALIQEVVDNTSSATGRIRETVGKAKESMIGMFSGYKFKQKNNTYQEKNTYRIDTQGEHEGITVKGWLAKKRKRYVGL